MSELGSEVEIFYKIWALDKKSSLSACPPDEHWHVLYFVALFNITDKSCLPAIKDYIAGMTADPVILPEWDTFELAKIMYTELSQEFGVLVKISLVIDNEPETRVSYGKRYSSEQAK